MPSSLELSISLPSSALKKSFHSPQRESLQPALPFMYLVFLIFGEHFLLGEGRVTGEPTLREM